MRAWVRFWGAFFQKKGHFACWHPLNRCHFYPFLTKIFFSEPRALDWVQWSQPINAQNRPCLVTQFSKYKVKIRMVTLKISQKFRYNVNTHTTKYIQNCYFFCPSNKTYFFYKQLGSGLHPESCLYFHSFRSSKLLSGSLVV